MRLSCVSIGAHVIEGQPPWGVLVGAQGTTPKLFCSACKARVLALGHCTEGKPRESTACHGTLSAVKNRPAVEIMGHVEAWRRECVHARSSGLLQYSVSSADVRVARESPELGGTEKHWRRALPVTTCSKLQPRH